MPDWTHWRLETPKRVNGKQCRPRSDAAADQGLHCLQIVQSFFFRNIFIISPDLPRIENGLFQYSVREFIQSLMG